MKPFIENITAQAFKGRDFSDDLTRLTTITGPNFSGKSARLDAIRLAILGNLPENGKTNESAFELAGGLRMSVTARISTGFVIQREYWRDGDAIKSAGTKDDWKTPLMDAGEYFQLTDSQRVAYVAARAEVKNQSTYAVIMEQLAEKLKVYPDEVFQSLWQNIGEVIEGNGVSDGITILTEKKGWLMTSYAEWNTRKRDSVGAVRKLSELQSREVSAETIGTLAANVAGIQAELSAANQRQGKLTQATMAANRCIARRTELENFLALSPHGDAKLKQLEAKLEELQHAPELIAGETLAEMRPKWEDIIARQQAAESDVRIAVASQNDAVAAQENLAHQKACPYCQSKGKTWKKTLEDKFSDDLAKATAARTKATEVLDEIKAERQILFTNMALREEAEKRDALAAKEIGATQADIKIERNNIERDAERRKTAANELASLDPAAVDQVALTASAQEVARLNERLIDAQETHQGAIKLQQDILRAAEASEAHQLASKYVEAITETGKFLKEQQAKAVADLFGGLLERANFFTAGILLAPLAFHEGEVGYWNASGKFVTHRVFSGTEKALTYVAIAAALSATGKLPTLILDEMGRIDPANRRKVLDRLKQAVEADMIGQAIVVHNEPLAADGWLNIALP